MSKHILGIQETRLLTEKLIQSEHFLFQNNSKNDIKQQITKLTNYINLSDSVSYLFILHIS